MASQSHWKYLNSLLLTTLVYFGSSCKKLIEVNAPYTSYTQANVYSNEITAIGALTGIYANMGSSYGQVFTTGARSISVFTGLSGDEFVLYSGVTALDYKAYYKNSLSTTGNVVAGSEYWPELYNKIFICNGAIQGLTVTTTLTSDVKKQLIGEAKFMRAFFYFYLTNLFGDVPLAITTDYNTNTALPRSSKEVVYQQIITDLEDAITMLSTEYLDGNLKAYSMSPERIRPTKWAAIALLARVYLYKGDYTNAEAQASQVINQSSLFSLAELNSTFLKNSSEAIWQLQPVNTGRNTEDAFTYILPVTGPSNTNPVYCSPWLLNSFEQNDQRKINWLGTLVLGTDTLYYPYKYKSATYGAPVTEYFMVLRISEQYLIRAEARAQLNKLSEASADLNLIRNKAGLPGINRSKSELINAIMHEKQVELFSEWGHRWLDLKRKNKLNEIMPAITQYKGGTWSANWQLYPLPIEDIQRDVNIQQNPGY